MIINRRVIRDSIDAARAIHQDISERDALKRLAAGEFDDLDEAMSTAESYPAATESDVDAVIATWAEEAKLLRGKAQSKAGAWAPHIVERWLVQADELEDRVMQATACDETEYGHE